MGYITENISERKKKQTDVSKHSGIFPSDASAIALLWINAQCQSMPLKIMALIQNSSKCRSMLINSDQETVIRAIPFEILRGGAEWKIINGRNSLAFDWH